MPTTQVRRLREGFRHDDERAREAVRECEEHHDSVLLPYEELFANAFTDAIQVRPESP